jgi:hypothetical protein
MIFYLDFFVEFLQNGFLSVRFFMDKQMIKCNQTMDATVRCPYRAI